MKPTKTWIVLADGDQAKIFEHDGPGKGLHIVKDVKLEQDHLTAQDIMADRPGRSYSSAGPGARSAVEYHSDPVAVRERRFVERLAQVLDEKQEGPDDYVNHVQLQYENGQTRESHSISAGLDYPGVGPEHAYLNDLGRAMLSGKCADIGKTKGPVLRGLAARAPYFHNGSAAQLIDAVNFYDQRFNIGFTAQEKSDLVAFLQSL